MSEEYTGLCKSKGWNWKRARVNPGEFEDLKVGCSTCILTTKSTKGFAETNAQLPEGVSGTFEGQEAVLSTKYSDFRKENISRFEALKRYVQSVEVADKAVLVSRKSPTQVQVLKCGSK